MSDFDSLPRDEPGNPLIRVSPDFTDGLMKQVREERRRYNRQRLICRGLIVASVVVVALVLWWLMTR